MTSYADLLDRYLAERRRYGGNLASSGLILRPFITFADAEGDEWITTDLFLWWKDRFGAAGTHSWAIRLSVVRGFAAWLQGIDPRTEVGGMADIGGRADAAGAQAETVEAGDLAAPALTVDTELVLGAALTGRLAADRVKATGRLEAGALRTAGALDAPSLSAATAAAVDGSAAARGIAGETLSVAGVLSGTRTAAGGIYGPDATISGLLTVGSCAGCEGE